MLQELQKIGQLFKQGIYGIHLEILDYVYRKGKFEDYLELNSGKKENDIKDAEDFLIHNNILKKTPSENGTFTEFHSRKCQTAYEMNKVSRDEEIKKIDELFRKEIYRIHLEILDFVYRNGKFKDYLELNSGKKENDIKEATDFLIQQNILKKTSSDKGSFIEFYSRKWHTAYEMAKIR